MKGSLVIDDVRPRTPQGFPAKAVVGRSVRVTADVFRDGHDALAARVRWRVSGEKKWSTAPMTHLGNDRWLGVIEPQSLGMHDFAIEAWTDQFATWRHGVEVKLAAGQDIDVELEEGARLLEACGRRVDRDDRDRLKAAVSALRDTARPVAERVAAAVDRAVVDPVSELTGADLSRSGSYRLWVDRERALAGAWYELFPRSYGGFTGATRRLDAVAAMGFDVVYLPPIHPIGRTARKGRNNSLVAEPGDPGSPWAIGGPEGGHTAINPELGSVEDFDAFVGRARELGMEVALDYALQCSADHPWVTQHPEWFHQRPDGSIKYAENPPKKYQDIYPINFWPADDSDRRALWEACREILDYWIARGVRVFRVDNPHTKPFPFWAWLLPTVQTEHPEVIFLSEAFTRPKVMAKLAEAGFSQSYTYFTWRTAKWEFIEYLNEIALGPVADYMRPNFWPTTPDILSGPLRRGGAGVFKQRVVLAATLSPSYGIYSGYELCENEPFSDANEEFLHSEKYEIKERDFDAPTSIAPYITAINDARKRHPALHELDNLQFQHNPNDNVLAFTKTTVDRSDVVLVVVNLDTSSTQEDTLGLDLASLGLEEGRPYEAHDELTGATYVWHGPNPYVRLSPDEPAHLLHLRSIG
jgi:starch synthase (maltosyl-transferring)